MQIQKKRPSAIKLYNIIFRWFDKEIRKFIDTERIISQESSSETETNSEAVFTSRLMSFTNLSKPINSTGVQTEDPEGNFSCIYSILYLFIY